MPMPAQSRPNVQCIASTAPGRFARPSRPPTARRAAATSGAIPARRAAPHDRRPRFARAQPRLADRASVRLLRPGLAVAFALGLTSSAAAQSPPILTPVALCVHATPHGYWATFGYASVGLAHKLVIPP